jgi:hypothetical protein
VSNARLLGAGRGGGGTGLEELDFPAVENFFKVSVPRLFAFLLM